MADQKISQLTEITNPNSNDVIPIVSGGETKKITVANLAVSGSSGTSGSNGSSGTSGINGTSGSSGTSLIWNFLGTYQVQIHNVGDVVTFDGQTWYCIQYAPSGAGPFGGYIGVYWTLISA